MTVIPVFHPVELERLDDDMSESESRASTLFWLDARVGRLARRLDGVPARRFARGDDIAILPRRLEGDHGVMARSFRLQQLDRMALLDLLVGDDRERDGLVVRPANVIESTQGIKPVSKPAFISQVPGPISLSSTALTGRSAAVPRG